MMRNLFLVLAFGLLFACQADVKTKIRRANIDNAATLETKISVDPHLFMRPKISWTALPRADHYDVNVFDENCDAEVKSYSKIKETEVQIDSDLKPNTKYCVIVTARDKAGRVIAQKKDIITLGDSPLPPVAESDDWYDDELRFEKKYYQTRSIKRLLSSDDFINSSLSELSKIKVEVDEKKYTCEVRQVASGDYAAVFASATPLLSYGANNVVLSLAEDGLPSRRSLGSVTLRDFDIFDTSITSFSQQEGDIKDNFQGWMLPVSGSVESGGTTLTIGMPNIINF